MFIPGLTYELLSSNLFHAECQGFYEWLRQQHHRGANLCSICTGAFLLAGSGLLNGKKATTHWRYLEPFKQRYAQVEVTKNCLFVLQERLFTSAGVSSGIDLALYLLEQNYGTKFALDIAKEALVYLRRGEADPQLSIFMQYRNHIDERIHEVQNRISQDIHQKWPIEELAEQVHMSARNLGRQFKKVTGITIGQFIEKIRVEHAVQLLGDGHKIEYVARNCGLQSTNQLRNLFKKHKNTLPSKL